MSKIDHRRAGSPLSIGWRMASLLLVAAGGCGAEASQLDLGGRVRDDALGFGHHHPSGVSQDPADRSADWPSAGHDWSHSGHNPREHILGRNSVADLVEVWRHEFSPAPGILVPVVAGAIVAGDTVYLTDMGGFVHARNANDGTPLWTQLVSTATPDPVFGSIFYGGAVATDDGLFVGDSASTIFKLDRQTGTTLWSTRVDTNPAALIQADLATFDGAVIFGVSSYENTFVNDLTMRGSVGALRESDGALKWQTYMTSDQSLPQPKWGAGVAVWSGAAIDPDRKRVFIGTGQYYEPGSATPSPASAGDQDYSDSLVQMSTRSGRVTKSRQFTAGDIFGLQYPIGPDADIGAPPNLFTVRGRHGRRIDAVGAADKTGRYYALERDTLRPLWSRQVAAGSVLGGFQATAAHACGVIYVAAHERIDGSSINTAMPPDLDATFLTTPEGTMLIQLGSRTHLMALDADSGDVLWERYAYGAITLAPLIVANDVLYHGNVNGRLCAIDATDGDELHCEQIGGMPDGAGGFVFGNMITGLSISRGRLYASYIPVLPGAPIGVSVFGL